MRRSEGINIGLGLVVFGVGYFAYSGIRKKTLFKKISDKIGYNQLNLNNYDEWFSPSYYRAFNDGNSLFLTDGKVLELTNKLGVNGFGTINDAEGVIYSVFREIPDGVALSQVSEKFGEKFEDLKERVNEMDTNEINTIAGILAEKPPYRTYNGETPDNMENV